MQVDGFKISKLDLSIVVTSSKRYRRIFSLIYFNYIGKLNCKGSVDRCVIFYSNRDIEKIWKKSNITRAVF